MLEYFTWRTRFKTLRCKLFGISDVGRWVNPANFEAWEERTAIIAGMIPPGSNVIELGAGRRSLERNLPSSCSYTPADIVTRGQGTLVFDLNTRPLPDLRSHRFDVAVLAGVLEYVARPSSFIEWLTLQVPSCILSYECARTRSGSLARLRESHWRIGAGWSNTFSESELTAIFGKAGFFIERVEDWKTKEGDERIFGFARANL